MKKKVVLVGHIYETNSEGNESEMKRSSTKDNKVKEEMGKFLLSIPKNLRRDIKFESDERGFENVSAYICYILRRREEIYLE